MGPPEMTGSNIVLVGSFNPSIFQPAWFKANNLLRPQECDAAKIELIHPEISSFSTEWLKIAVFLNRFAVETADAHHFEPLRDLVLGIFGLLEHTPVSKMGLNRQMHFSMPSLEKWHGFGHMLAPKEPWKGIMEEPGLLSMTMQDPRKEPPGYVRVKIESSKKIKPGIYIEVNNHYEFEGDNVLQKLMIILKNSWSETINFSDKIAEHLLGQEY